MILQRGSLAFAFGFLLSPALARPGIARAEQPKTATSAKSAKTSATVRATGGAGAPATLTPASLLVGPSLHETGRIGKMIVSGTQIQKTTVGHGMPREPTVQRVIEPPLGPPAPAMPSPGVIDQATLVREVRSHFVALDECRIEVARHKRIAPAAIAPLRLTLRWTILRSGNVSDTTVIATSRANLRIIDCVKRRMSTWTFTPPGGGTVRVERSLTIGPRLAAIDHGVQKEAASRGLGQRPKV